MDSMERSEKNPLNRIIFELYDKKIIAALNDDDFFALRRKMMPITTASVSNAIHKDLSIKDRDRLRSDDFEVGFYKRCYAMDLINIECAIRYNYIFEFVKRLSLKHIYDIGCGSKMQGLMLVDTPDAYYVGIDESIFHDITDGFACSSEDVNRILSKHWGDKIQYICKHYPFCIEAEENHVAIFSYCEMGIRFEVVNAIRRDFDRVIVTIQTKKYCVDGMTIDEIINGVGDPIINVATNNLKRWQQAMPDYKFYRLANSNYLYATKHYEDEKKIKQFSLIINGVIYLKDME